jgi:hypothetical protein
VPRHRLRRHNARNDATSGTAQIIVINTAIGNMADVTAARDELRRLVDQLPEEQVPAALAEVQRLAGGAETPAWPPPWFGAVTSGRSDTSARADELLAEGFGR